MDARRSKRTGKGFRGGAGLAMNMAWTGKRHGEEKW
jgi:hypothetical protein